MGSRLMAEWAFMMSRGVCGHFRSRSWCSWPLRCMAGHPERERPNCPCGSSRGRSALQTSCANSLARSRLNMHMRDMGRADTASSAVFG